MDPITFLQKACGRIFSRELFAFRREIYGAVGLQPDPVRDRQTRLGKIFGARLFSRVYPGVPGRVHVHDSMLQNDSPDEIAHYIAVGQSAMKNIDAALAAAGRSFEDIDAVLDMACGCGRVLRWLSRRVRDPRRITACEVQEENIRFCHEEFGAEPLLSGFDLSALHFPRKYDLIWVGSLFTHLPPAEGMAFLEKLANALNPGGVLLFSTQGPSCLAQLAMYGWMFESQSEALRVHLETTGAAFAPYFENNPGYGIALHKPEYLDRGFERAFGDRIKRIYYAARGWDGHQDMHGFQLKR